MRNRQVAVTDPHSHSNVSSPLIVAPVRTSVMQIASGDAAAIAAMSFRAAAQQWLESRRPYLRARTFIGYEQHVKHLNVFFGDLKVRNIHIGHLMGYQLARTQNENGRWPKAAGASLVNHEISTVQQIMKRGRVWVQVAEHYVPMQLPGFRSPKVLDDLEERRLFAVAATRPEWQVGLLIATVTRWTGASGCELRNLRYEDVILDSGDPRFIIRSETAKNQYRGRSVGLLPEAQAALEQCMERGRELGASRPDHYIFPFRIAPGQWDPTRPTTDAWLRRSFQGMREAAGLPWLTPHCLRHQFITTLLERGAAPQTVRHIVGHVSEAMMNHYSHNRMETQMATLRLLESPLTSALPKGTQGKPPVIKDVVPERERSPERARGKQQRKWLQRRGVRIFRKSAHQILTEGAGKPHGRV